MVDRLVDRKYEIYPFYKTPDGENCLEKTYYYTKYGAIAGAVFSVYEMAIVSKPSNVRACIARFGHFTAPAAAVGFAFGSILCIVAQLRKKDGIPNHLIAGALSGCIYGAKYRSMTAGHYGALLIGFGAAYIKFFKVYNLPIMEMRKVQEGPHFPNVDLTVKLYDDPGRPDRA